MLELSVLTPKCNGILSGTKESATSTPISVSYNCFLLKSFIAIISPKIDMTTENRAGIIKSDGTTSPESKSTFFDVKINGLNLAIGSMIPSKDITATIPPVKRMLVKVCLKITQPTIKILKYRKPINQRAKAAIAT